jgi:hypothetical protein
MPKITHVKRAQVRYPTVPTVDGNGNQVVTPVLRRDGRQKVTKAGKAVSRRATHDDRTAEPLPNHKCGRCGTEILPGMPYKWMSPRSGPYGGRKLYRCEPCPSWQPWEYSQSMNALLAEISYNFATALDSAESGDDVQGALDEAAENVRSIAEGKRESAQNMEDGFQHSTSQSEELADTAGQLDSWADEIESATIPEFPEDVTEGPDGWDAEAGEKIQEWREEVAAALAVVDEPPV